MRRAPGLVAIIALILAQTLSLSGTVSAASDWEEDDPYTRIPRPAPPIRRAAPPRNRAADNMTERVIEDPDAATDSRRTAFSETRESDAEKDGSHSSHGGKPRLEGGVSKYGLGADQGAPGSARMDGSAARDIFQMPVFIPQRPVSTPPTAFRGWLEKTHPQFALSTAGMSRDLVLEVKGQWDDSARTVRALGIPHTIIKARMLADYPLDQVKVMIINCEGRVPPDSLQRIRDFVARGGHLISTDWTLDGVVRRAFPGYVEWNGGHTAGGVVDGTIVEDDPTLTPHLPRRSGWKLDDGSQTVHVINRTAVHVLVRSATLARSGDDPDAQGVLAFWFPFGRGAVLHLVGHFDNNTNLAHLNMLPDPAPGIGISLRQAIASNFLVAALSEKRRPPRPPAESAR